MAGPYLPVVPIRGRPPRVKAQWPCIARCSGPQPHRRAPFETSDPRPEGSPPRGNGEGPASPPTPASGRPRGGHFTPKTRLGPAESWENRNQGALEDLLTIDFSINCMPQLCEATKVGTLASVTVVLARRDVTPTFSNVLNYRVNAKELILDFGAFFPVPGGPQRPAEADFHTRIVLGADIIEAFIGVLQEMRKSRDQARESLMHPTQPADKSGQGSMQ